MTYLSDATIDHLRRIADLPDVALTRYEILETIGRGGMATVYLARDRELQRDVALKVLGTPDLTPEASARMLGEARIIARLEHPGIVPVHDVGRLPDGRIYYAMKRVSGRRLDEIVRARAPRAELVRIFQRIVEAVAFSHAHGVIHRDLKPENVMVGSFGEVLVMDWGLAKVLSAPEREMPPDGAPARPGETGHGTVLGTPGYMAPEQARGEIASVDERSDIYALGAILYFLLVARPPGSGPADSERTTQTLSPPAAATGVVPPRQIDKTIPKPLQAIALKALASDRAARYGSAGAMGDDVQAFVDGLPVAAHPEGLFDRSRRLLHKYRVAVGLIAAYLIMRVLFVLWIRAQG